VTAGAPRDSVELRPRRENSRAIPWEAHAEQLASLGPKQRAIIADDWLARMKSEHLAVGAFSLIACELAEAGCEPVVLAMITRAASDEVRHTDVCKRLAIGLLGRDAVPERLRGVPSVPKHEGVSVRDRALLHVVEMCCFNETFTGVYLTAMLERTTDETARAAIESLLEDEIDHGRVGWAHLGACVRAGFGAAVVEPALPAIVARTVDPVLACANRGHAADPLLEAHGWLSSADAAAIYRDAFAEVVLPGLSAAGIDVAGIATR
jgi:hypothetical protein